MEDPRESDFRGKADMKELEIIEAVKCPLSGRLQNWESCVKCHNWDKKYTDLKKLTCKYEKYPSSEGSL